MSDQSRAAWPDAIADEHASLLWFVAKKQFSTKEPQEAPLPKNHRKLQENHHVFNEYSRQNPNAIDQFRQGHAYALNLKDSGPCTSRGWFID